MSILSVLMNDITKNTWICRAQIKIVATGSYCYMHDLENLKPGHFQGNTGYIIILKNTLDTIKKLHKHWCYDDVTFY